MRDGQRSVIYSFTGLTADGGVWYKSRSAELFYLLMVRTDWWVYSCSSREDFTQQRVRKLPWFQQVLWECQLLFWPSLPSFPVAFREGFLLMMHMSVSVSCVFACWFRWRRVAVICVRSEVRGDGEAPQVQRFSRGPERIHSAAPSLHDKACRNNGRLCGVWWHRSFHFCLFYTQTDEGEEKTIRPFKITSD